MKSEQLSSLVSDVNQCNPRLLGRSQFTYIDISSLDNSTKLLVSPQRIAVDLAPSRARQRVQTGDVLVSTVRPNLNAVALVPKAFDGEIASTGFCVLRSRPEKLCHQYLFYFTQSAEFVAHLVKRATGASYPAVTDADILDAGIPLPDLSEQRRIAKQLEQADRLRRTRRYALELSGDFLFALFRQLFGSRFEQGPFRAFGDMVKITGGGTPARERAEYYRGRIPWLTSKDMKGDYIWDTEEHITEEAIQESATNLVPAGSILVVVKSKVLMHRLPVAITNVPLCHGQDIKSIQCGEHIQAEFARFVLKFHEGRLLNIARGANTEGLTLPMLEELPVPIVSSNEQEQFRKLVVKHERLRAVQREALRQAEHLFATLLDRAFRGQ